MANSTKSDNDRRIPLAKQYSKEMEGIFENSHNLFMKFELLDNSKLAIYPEPKLGLEIRRDIDKSRKIIEKATPEDRIDRILLDDILERFVILERQMEKNKMKVFNYGLMLRMLGLDTNDVKLIEAHFRSIDYQELSNQRTELIGQYSSSKLEGVEYIQNTTEIFKKLMELVFELSPKNINGIPINLDEYMKSVQISEAHGGNSYHSSGRVMLNVNNIHIIEVKQGFRYIPIIEVIGAADLIGEESLLGHQGQFLISESAEIPKFLKISRKPISLINAETLGNLGSATLKSKLLENPTILEKWVDIENFKLIQKYHELYSKNEEILLFIDCFESFIHMTTGRDPKHTAEVMHSITNGEGFLSEEHIERIRVHYSNYFWNNISSKISKWGYLYSDMLLAEIEKRLEGKDSEYSNNVLDNLKIGFWSKKGFEEYLNYLLEYFKRD